MPLEVIVAWGGGLLVLFLPGLALASLVRGPLLSDPIVRLAVAAAFGLAFWPLLLLLTSTGGLRLGPGSTRLVLAAAAIGLAFGRARTGVRPRVRPLVLATFGVVFLVTAATRIAHVARLALPAWVDPVHHHLVASLLVNGGRLPETYAPVLADVPAVYHWGFHAGLAAVAWLVGVSDPFDLARLLLQYGQLLQALVPLTLYAGARVLFRSRTAGVLAALSGGLVSWFPAYYVAWGRYPQLAGALLLPGALLVCWEAGRRGGAREGTAAALLLAGLFLVHVRVALFAGTLLAVLVPLAARRGGARVLGRLAAAGGLALLLVSPWVIRLVREHQLARALPAATASERERWREYNRVPGELFLSPNARELTALASGGLTGIAGWGGMPLAGRVLSLALCAAVLLAERRARRAMRRRRRLPRFPFVPLALLWGWAGLTALLLNTDRLGLPPLRIAPSSAAGILAYLPLSLAAAGVATWVIRRLPPAIATPRLAVASALGLSITSACGLADVIPPFTVLATEGDLRALRWCARELPPDAVVAIRAMPWIGGTVVGRDGGYWLSVLTGHRTNVPPALSQFASAAGLPPEPLARWADVWSLSDPEARALLRASGATHLFVGESPGPLEMRSVARLPFLMPLYRDGAVGVFAVTSGVTR